MSSGSGTSPIQQIGEGYGSLLRSLAQTLLFILIILALSLAISLPLWYFALNFKEAFTAVMLLLLGGYLLLTLGKRILYRIRTAEKPASKRLKALSLKIGRVIGTIAFVYLFLVLISGPTPLLAVPYTIIGLLALGYIFFVGRR
jgi:L-asparagine transporter-like permease